MEAILMFHLMATVLFALWVMSRRRSHREINSRMRTALKTYSRMDPFARAERRPR